MTRNYEDAMKISCRSGVVVGVVNESKMNVGADRLENYQTRRMLIMLIT